MLDFGNNRYFILLLILPVVAGFYFYAHRRRRRMLHRFCGSEQMAAELVPSFKAARQTTRAAMVLSAVVCCVISFAGPRWGYHFEEIAGRSASIAVVLDLSRSMLAEDSRPNRLARAKRELLDLLKLLNGERVGVVGFAGSAYVQSPLTVDYSVLESYILDMNPDLSISSKGSDIGLAVSTAARLFKENDSGAVILVSDGEDFEGGLIRQAEKLKDAGTILYAIGVGKSEGAPVPVKDGFKKDSSGNIVITRLDEGLMKQAAELTGGFYVRSVPGDDDIRAIYNSGIKKQVGEVEYNLTRQKVWEERFQWFLLPAFLLLVAEQLLAVRIWRGR